MGGTGARADTAWRKRVPLPPPFWLPNNAICAAVMHQFLANLLAQTLACELRAPVISSRFEAKMEDGTSRRGFQKAPYTTRARTLEMTRTGLLPVPKGRVGRTDAFGFPQ